MKKGTIRITTPQPDDVIRAGDFALLPTITESPIITSHPLRNFHQTTWNSPVINAFGKFEFKPQKVKLNVDTFTIRKNTALEWGLYCSDPSNVTNPSDISNLTFVWKRDGQPLYKYNRQNEGRGAQFLQISEEDCTEELNGSYTCEVSNDFGTTTSVPFVLEIVDTENTDRLYTNLLLNGDGRGGLDGWTNADGLVMTDSSNTDNTLNPSSLTTWNGNNFPISTGSNYRPFIPYKFKGAMAEGNLFYGGYDRWYNLVGEQLLDLNLTNSQLSSDLPEYLKYGNTAQRQPIIPNEDYGKGGRQGFYPGIKLLDTYNRNTTQTGIRLQDEFQDQTLTYFGRKEISFGEAATSTFNQEVNVSDLKTMIDGNVGGIEYVTAQFFSYVGCAISRYTIRIQEQGNSVDYNYFIHDLDTIRAYLNGNSLERINPDPGSVIEIIPIADDTTTITIECLSGNGETISSKQLQGPTALDMWALKEKVDWSLTLYPLFAFFNQNNNPIKVFGQIYTNTQALAPLFAQSTNNIGNLTEDNYQQLANQVSDINAKFILRRYGELYSQWSQSWPKDIWEDTGNTFIFQGEEQKEYANISVLETRRSKAFVDKGVSAFVAVGGTINLPINTEGVRVSVNFTNDSISRIDDNPEVKGWNDQYIYNTLLNVQGTENTVGKPYYKYGNPRCAITKMKLVLVPNADVASPNHTTYQIPPLEFTTLGVAKQAALSIGNDASKKQEFRYTLYQPEQLPPSPDPTIISIETEEMKEVYKTAVEDQSNIEPGTRLPAGASRGDLEEAKAFAKLQIDIEESDRMRSENPDAGTIVGPTSENPDTPEIGPEDLPTEDPASEP